MRTRRSFRSGRVLILTLRQRPSRLVFFSAKTPKSYLSAGYRPGDALVFGKESTGLDEELLERHAEEVYGIPTLGAVRSLNLSNAVSIVVYEALRQVGALDAVGMGE